MSDIDSYPDYVWWVTPGLLAGMSRPTLEDLPQLYQAGMRGIVSVMDEPSGIDEYRGAGFQALWLPITGGKPPTVEQVTQFVQFAEPLLESHQPVVVHCTSVDILPSLSLLREGILNSDSNRNQGLSYIT